MNWLLVMTKSLKRDTQHTIHNITEHEEISYINESSPGRVINNKITIT